MSDVQISSDLLREGVSDAFRIRSCDISINVLPDLQTAEYVYRYQIERIGLGDDKWREVFAYPVQDVVIHYARVGRPGLPANVNHGLHYQTKALDTPERNTCLVIDFDRKVATGEKYEFHYACRTRIEAIKNVSLFGGTGSIWFWCAHEFSCDAMKVTVQMPTGIRVTATHPVFPALSGFVTFYRTILVPREFFVVLLTYEKRVLRFPVRYAGLIEIGATFILGAVASYVANLVWHLTKGE